MKLRVHEPGLFIEELVFQIRPELVDRYVELEYEIMAKELAGRDGFCGWQIWVSETNPGRVTSLYFWSSQASHRNLDQEWLSGKKDEIARVFGAENMTFVRAGHETDRRYQMRSLA